MPRFNRQLILNAAVRVARRPGGWAKMTRALIAREAGCADGLVSNYLGSMEEIRKTLIKEAIRIECFDLISQGLASGHTSFKKLPEGFRQKAFDHIFGE